MTSELDTVRLADDTDTPLELREMLDAAVADTPSAAETARMIARLDAVAAGPAPTASAAAGASTKAWIAGLLGGAVVVSVAVYAVVALMGGQQSEAPTRTPGTGTGTGTDTDTGTGLPQGPPRRGTETQSPAASTSPSPSAASTRAKPTPPAPRPTTRRSPPPPKRPALAPSELDIIRRARVAMRAGKLAAALEQTRAHSKHFPRGILTEEREAIAIEALARLGRTDSARRRLARFSRAYPSSSYRHRLRGLVK